MAEFVCPFIRREPWWIGGDFEKRSAWLPKVDRMKIDAIHHRTDVISETEDLFSPRTLLRIVRNAKCNVVHRSGPETGSLEVGPPQSVYRFAGSGWPRAREREAIPDF